MDSRHSGIISLTRRYDVGYGAASAIKIFSIRTRFTKPDFVFSMNLELIALSLAAQQGIHNTHKASSPVTAQTF